MVKVAIAHDYLTQRGGAERVVLDLAAAFPDAPIYTSLYAPDRTFPEFKGLDVRVGSLNRVALFRRNHRLAFPLLAPAFRMMQADADVVICSSSGWAHGISTRGKKVVYCHNPARWLYQYDEYVPGVASGTGPLLKPLFSLLRRWDAKAAASADAYFANSFNVAARIMKTYGIDSDVIHPAAGLEDVEETSRPLPAAVSDNFVLCVCRLLSYKNIGAVIEGVREIEGLQLVVVGAGPDEAKLRQQAADSDVVFLSKQSDDAMRSMYQHCRAAISASHEDFGLMPIEAATLGSPSVVLRRGGFVETVIEGVTGEFFDAPEPKAIAAALRRTIDRDWDTAMIKKHGGSFSRSNFMRQITAGVQRLVDKGHSC